MTDDRVRAPAPGVNPPPQERSTHDRSPGVAEEHPRSKEQDEWQERLRAAVAETLALRARKAAMRAEFAERRKHGLIARHNAKLRRNAGDTTKEK